ncbi:ferredoxin family protein [Candidatus Sumerlaeota bacterium]|nr:ferredoxin family protein [Candidatus Sumerlaeota bacterium]
MSANWYPIIDEEKCTGCLSCVEFCPHGVLAEKDGTAVVVAPEKCVDFCRGCQKVCEFNAITYANGGEQK